MKWPLRKVGDIADLCLGKMLDQKKNKGVLRPYLANVNVRWGTFELDELRQMRFEDHELERYGIRNGDIVMCEGGEPGRCAIWREQLPGMMLQKALHRVRVKSGVDHRFLYYNFLDHGRTGTFEQYFTGSTIKHLPGEKLALVEVAIPPVDVQRRIASILSAYDDLIENNTRRIAILEEMARRIYEEWFIRFRFPGHESVRMVDSELGLLPEGWCIRRLGEAIELPYGKALKAEDRKEGDVPVYGSSGVVGYHAASLTAGPGIIVGRKGNVGSVHWSNVPFYPIDTVFYVRTALPLHYVFFNLKQQNFLNNDAAVPGLNRNQAYSLPLLVPDNERLTAFENICESTLGLARILMRKNANLRTTRDLLLSKLITGELDVSEVRGPEAMVA